MEAQTAPAEPAAPPPSPDAAEAAPTPENATETPSTETTADDKPILAGDGEDVAAAEGDDKKDEKAAAEDKKDEPAEADAKDDKEPDKKADAKPADDKDKKADADEPEAKAGDEAEDTDDAASEDEAASDGLPEDFDWRALAADEKNQNRLKHFASMDDLAEFVREADSFKRRAVVPPNSKSTAEDVAKFHKAIGVPESPEGYEIEMEKDADESDIQRTDRLKMAAHAVHVTPDQLGAMIEWNNAEQEAVARREEESLSAFRNQVKTDLAREWGPDYQRNLTIASDFAKETFGGYADDFLSMKLEDGTMIGDHPIMNRGMAKVARRFGEAGIPGEIVPDTWAPTEGDLMKMQQEPGYVDGTDKDLIQRVTIGYQRLYPTK